MGVKFGREYNDIVNDLTTAIGQIRDCYDFFEMSEEDWTDMSSDEQAECLKTLADDVFFALGSDSTIQVGQGLLVYEKSKHIIKVDQGENIISLIQLT